MADELYKDIPDENFLRLLKVIRQGPVPRRSVGRVGGLARSVVREWRFVRPTLKR